MLKKALGIDADKLGLHTMILGTTGRGRSKIAEDEAARRGISVEELERLWAPSEEELARRKAEEDERSRKAARRLASMKQAYWDNSEAEDFDGIHDACVSLLDVEMDIPRIRVVFDRLPKDIFGLAVQWGFDDTEVGDHVYRFIRDNLEVIRADLGVREDGQ